MAWLLPHTSGPANSMPAMSSPQRSASGTPDETTPHMNAHIGGNQVTGFSSASTSRGAGTRRAATGGGDISIGVN